MIPTTVSSSPSTATISGTTGNNHSTSNNLQLNSFSTMTPTSSSLYASTATSPQSTQTSSIMLGLAALILEGRALADDEFQPHTTRTTATTNDANCLGGSGSGSGNGNSGNGIGTGANSSNIVGSNLFASTSYGISGSGSGSGSGTIGCGRQSPTCRPSTSRAAASFYSGGGSSGHVINITTNPYAFNSNIATRDSRPRFSDPYNTNSGSESASSSAESTHQRWAQKLCQLRQVSPAASLSTAYEQPITVEAREPELVALAINESGANERGEFEIIRRSLLNRTNLNAMSSSSSTMAASAAAAASSNSAGAGSVSSSPGSGSGSENFLFSLQSLATTCLRSGSPSMEPSGGSGSANTTGTPCGYRYASLSSPPPQHSSMYMYRAATPTATMSAAHRFHDQHGSASSCGSGVQSPRPHHWTSVASATAAAAAVAENSSILHGIEKYMRHASNTGLSLGTGRIPIPGTAVSTTIGTTLAAAAAANVGSNTTKVANATAIAAANTTASSKYPQQGPHCDQFLKKMGLAKGEAAENEEHICDSSNLNLSCSRWRAYCNKIEVIMGRGEPVCIEVYLGPVNHKILLEQWIITQREKGPPPSMTLPSLCSAIRSQLYFSQISAWCDLIKKSDKTIYDTGRIIFPTPTGAAGDLATHAIGSGGNSSSGAGGGVVVANTNININMNMNMNITPGTSPNSHTLNQLNTTGGLLVNERPRLNIYYRIKSFDSTACFNSKPNVHNFPNVNISENCSISVCLKSLPRINGGIPKIGTLMLSSNSGQAAAIVTQTATSTATTTTMATNKKTNKVKGNENKTMAAAHATSTPAAAATTTTTLLATGLTTSPMTNASNGNVNNSSVIFRNGDSCVLAQNNDTPRTSRSNRCGVAANLSTTFSADAASTSATVTSTTTSGAAKTLVHIECPSSSCSSSSSFAHRESQLAKSNSNTSATPSISSNAAAANSDINAQSISNDDNVDDDGNSQDSHISCAASKHKCMFFIGEDELLDVNDGDCDADADAEAFGDDDDNRSDTTATSAGDSLCSTGAYSSGGNMSHREKQLMKYRKRMLKRDKKHHQHHQHQHQHQRKALSTTSDASYELGAAYELQRRQEERRNITKANGCQPMEEGDEEEEEDVSLRCTTISTNTTTTVTPIFHQHTSTQIEMISTGTQTPMSCCRQCGCEKTLICLRCSNATAGGGTTNQMRRREKAIDEPTERIQHNVDDMDDSTTSSLSSSEIIHTPRNKAELLLQAIQRTPKVAAAKHKQEQPRHQCGYAHITQNNNQLKNAATTLANGKGGNVSTVGGGGGGGNGSAGGSGCQVCKRQKTQHNFGNSNGGALTLNTPPNQQLANNKGDTYNDDVDDNNCDDDICEDTTDDDGGKKYDDNNKSNTGNVEGGVDANQHLTTPLTVLAPSAEVMEEESFISSTKLTPQIDRCTLSSNSTNNSPNQQHLTNADRAGGDHKVASENSNYSRTGNRTPPTIITYMEGECFDESQFRTPTTTTQDQHNAQKLYQHKQTPKPSLLQLRCNYLTDMSGGNVQAAGASGDGFGKVPHNTPSSKLQKQTQQGGSHNALLLRKGLPKVNLTPIFCNPMPTSTTTTGAHITSSKSSPIPIHGAATNNDTTTFSFDPNLLNLSGNQLQLHHQLMHSSNGTLLCGSPLNAEANNIPVQKSYSAPTLPNSPSLSPRFAKQAAIYKRRSRHLSDRSDRSSLGSDEQFSDEDLESGGMYSPATSPLKQCARVAAAFGRLPLLGNLEESLLQKRLMPKVEVMGFKVLLGASGGFCPTQLTIPAAAYFYELQGETLSTPYMCEIRLPRKGYSVPRAGTVQATLLNPMGTVVRMFVIPYDMRDMPPLHQTFIRQRILAEASSNEAATPNVQASKDGQHIAYTNGFGDGGDGDGSLAMNNNSDCYQNNNNNNNNNVNAKNKYRLSPSGGLQGESNLGHFISAEHMKRLRYSIHLRFQTSRSGRLTLHTDIRLLISRRTEYDTAAAHAKGVLEAPNDLVTDTVMPTNPRYSPRPDQSSNGSGSSGSSSISTNIIASAVMTANSTCMPSLAITTAATTAPPKTTTNTNNNNGSASSKI